MAKFPYHRLNSHTEFATQLVRVREAAEAVRHPDLSGHDLVLSCVLTARLLHLCDDSAVLLRIALGLGLSRRHGGLR